MLTVETSLEKLYATAQTQGVAVEKASKICGTYGCCGNHAPKIEKYKITHDGQKVSLFVWGKRCAQVELNTQIVKVESVPELSPYEKNVVTWFLEKACKG